MRITLNGVATEVAAHTTVGQLVDRVTGDRSRIAVERNLEIVKRASFDEVAVVEGDVVEVVTLVGGG